MSAKDERRPLLSECCLVCNSSECSGCPDEKAKREDGGKISFSLNESWEKIKTLKLIVMLNLTIGVEHR